MREWSKSLIWFTALLLPLQTLQGSSTLCHFACHGNQTLEGVNDPSRCRCPRKTVNIRWADGGRQQYTARLLAYFGKTCPVDDCPAKCFCRRPAHPQCQPVSPVQLKIAEGLGISIIPQVPAKCNALLHGYGESQREISTNISALQFCVFLCRLTI